MSLLWFINNSREMNLTACCLNSLSCIDARERRPLRRATWPRGRDREPSRPYPGRVRNSQDPIGIAQADSSEGHGKVVGASFKKLGDIDLAAPTLCDSSTTASSPTTAPSAIDDDKSEKASAAMAIPRTATDCRNPRASAALKSALEDAKDDDGIGCW